ncbi:ABC transporter permease [Caenispirillum bisanense]|uniref:Simple sugar transport system permease protein n=1 Tax=Caenispirillum bisanense TaxID=414052 RepID=A0A286GX59_9PROT|nr:ABC transporter permease [Caenispirillum bisanense]SOD99756.1 simple sugar transport system permease protein [Caenispirillum bisanense]
MDIFLDILISASLWATVLRIATPLILGTLGELVCERAGVLNLGIEGIMTLGAMVGWMTVYQGGDLWTGVLVAALAGMLAGLLHAALTVPLGLSQHVTGIGVTLLATSLSYYTYRLVLPQATTPPTVTPFQPIGDGSLLGSLPVIGPVLAQQTPLTYFALAAVVVVAWVLHRTPVGLAVRMVGENPAAADAQGLNVTGVRIGAVMAGSALMAVGGAFLTLSAFNAFFFNMINGRGWICIALVVFASWRPGKALLGALLFALFDALQTRLQQVSGAAIPYQIYLMMPYVLSIVALIVMSRRAAYPRALMVPFRKGER